MGGIDQEFQRCRIAGIVFGGDEDEGVGIVEAPAEIRQGRVAVSTLHFHGIKELIRSARSRGNQRRYPRGVLCRVAVIEVAQRMGIPLAAIRDALSTLPEGRTPTADWSRLSAWWRADLDDRIAKLTRLRDQLADCIGCGSLSTRACPLRNSYDELSEQGPGPRLLDPA